MRDLIHARGYFNGQLKAPPPEVAKPAKKAKASSSSSKKARPSKKASR